MKKTKEGHYLIGLSPKKRWIPKPIKSMLIGTGVLLVAAVAGGVGYTWLVGRNAPKEITTETPKPQPQSLGVLDKPRRLPPDAPVQASVRFVTATVKPGENAIVEIHTRPEAKCIISVENDDNPMEDSGLVEKIADEFGNVSWSWTVDSAVQEGLWTAKITCKYSKKSGYVEAYIEVKP